MPVFRFELKQYSGSVWMWSIALAGAILFALPMFVSLTGDTSAVDSLEGNSLLDLLGINPDLFFTTTGIFAYLNSFLLLAAAIQACNLGLSITSKEHMQNTADFLITKPYSRTKIFVSKLFAAICMVVIIGVCYFLASFGAMNLVSDQAFSFRIFFQIYLTFPLIQLFFLLAGMTIGVIFSRIASPLPLALGVAFGLFVIGVFSNVVQSTLARVFSPFRYFDINLILAAENYETNYLVLFVSLLVILICSCYAVFIKKDMKMVL